MKLTKFFVLFLILAGFVSACNLPSRTPTPAPDFPPITSIPLTAVVTVAPTTISTPITSVPTSAPANTVTPMPTVAPTSGTTACTHSADFVTDISIPDGTTLDSNVSFVKTWRIKNTGTCTWDSRYSLAFVDGTLLMPVNYVPLSVTVAPGQTIDLSLNMTSPIYPGSYESDWKLRTPSGAFFGVGKGDAPLWVKVTIGSPSTTNIMGYVYQDRNENNIYDADDVLMANREVWLQDGSCGQARTRLTSTVSGSDGRYNLTGMFSGTMCVELMGSNGGMDDVFTVSVVAGQTMTNVDLRAAVPNGMISGWVWNDLPGNPQVAISGAVVSVQRGQCGSPLSVTVSAITDSTGHYSFSDLYDGPHCVSIRTFEGNNASVFGNGSWSYPVNGIQQLNLTSGQEGIANFGWRYK